MSLVCQLVSGLSNVAAHTPLSPTCDDADAFMLLTLFFEAAFDLTLIPDFVGYRWSKYGPCLLSIRL